MNFPIELTPTEKFFLEKIIARLEAICDIDIELLEMYYSNNWHWNITPRTSKITFRLNRRADLTYDIIRSDDKLRIFSSAIPVPGKNLLYAFAPAISKKHENMNFIEDAKESIISEMTDFFEIVNKNRNTSRMLDYLEYNKATDVTNLVSSVDLRYVERS